MRFAFSRVIKFESRCAYQLSRCGRAKRRPNEEWSITTVHYCLFRAIERVAV